MRCSNRGPPALVSCALFAEAQQIWNTKPDLCLQQFNHVVNESSRTIQEVEGNLDGEGGEEWNFSNVLLAAVFVITLPYTPLCVSLLPNQPLDLSWEQRSRGHWKKRWSWLLLQSQLWIMVWSTSELHPVLVSVHMLDKSDQYTGWPSPLEKPPDDVIWLTVL